jgi:hypothetical protein
VLRLAVGGRRGVDAAQSVVQVRSRGCGDLGRRRLDAVYGGPVQVLGRCRGGCYGASNNKCSNNKTRHWGSPPFGWFGAQRTMGEPVSPPVLRLAVDGRRCFFNTVEDIHHCCMMPSLSLCVNLDCNAIFEPVG